MVNNPDKAALLYNSNGKGENIIIENIGNETLTSVNSEKLLGLHIDSNLEWNNHVDKINMDKNSKIFSKTQGTSCVL